MEKIILISVNSQRLLRDLKQCAVIFAPQNQKNQETMKDVQQFEQMDIEEAMRVLEEEGWQPMECDTAVPFFDKKVPCGKPAGMGDVTMENIDLPKELLSMQPEFVVRVTGDSMRDADIEQGDFVKVVMDTRIYDGDIVLASLDDEVTLKGFCEDEDGDYWLVPRNDAYEPILLTEGQNVRIVGKVTEVMRPTPRLSTKSLLRCIREAKRRRCPERRLSGLAVSQAIRGIAPEIGIGRLWYAVYRVLADENVIAENDFGAFVDMVRMEVPAHDHLPTRQEMQRMAVLSFSKPVARWRQDNAPVQGARYNEYVRIARSMEKKLS